MTEDALSISPHESGVIRLFSVDIDAADLERIKSPKPDMPPLGAAIGELVGLDWIDPSHAELFDVDDLEELGLSGYLTEGAGVPAAALKDKRQKLNEITGVVLILFTRAFDSNAGDLTLARNVALLDVFHEAGADIQFSDLPPSKAATEPGNQGTPAAHPHLNVMKAMLILPALCILLGLIIWLVLL